MVERQIFKEAYTFISNCVYLLNENDWIFEYQTVNIHLGVGMVE